MTCTFCMAFERFSESDLPLEAGRDLVRSVLEFARDRSPGAEAGVDVPTVPPDSGSGVEVPLGKSNTGRPGASSMWRQSMRWISTAQSRFSGSSGAARRKQINTSFKLQTSRLIESRARSGASMSGMCRCLRGQYLAIFATTLNPKP